MRLLPRLLAVFLALAGAGGAAAATPQVTIGQSHTLALDADGRLFAWGADSLGQLGQGNQLHYPAAVPIAGLPAVKAVSARFQSVAALDLAGNVWTWGLYGLGERAHPDVGRPGRVLGISGVARIESGFYGTGAIRTDGQVWGWGRVVGAQYPRPTRFAALDGAVDIAVGVHELVIVRPDGSVWQLGGEDLGQFAAGEAPTAAIAARVAGLPLMNRVHSFNVADTDSRFAGIDRNGEVWLWGCWNAGACRAAKTGAARKATGLPSKVGAISLDYFALYAALEAGSTYRASMPGGVLAGAFAAHADFTDAKVLAGYDGTLYSLRNSGAVDSAGFNSAGELGIGTVGGFFATRQGVVGLSSIVGVASGQFAGYAVRSDGVLFGWGADYSGAISGNARFGQSLPLRIGLPSGVTASRIAAGARSSFAITTTGALYAWGDNFYANLGLGNDADQSSPVLVPVTSVVDVAGGVSFSALVRSDGSVWLNNASGFSPLAGLANARRVFVPKHLEGYTPERDPVFALDSVGVLHGFGYDTRGSGIFTQPIAPDQFRAPAPVSGLPLPVADFSVASDHALALLTDGTVWAWGRNADGQLGDGTTTGRAQPAQVTGLTNVVAVSAGRCHSLALRSDGAVWSWGCNTYGELGDGTRTSRSTPAQVASLDRIAQVVAGFHTSFAVRAGGLVFAWGNSSADVVTGGTLGDGALVPRVRPVLVSRENGLGNVDRDDWFLDLEPGVADQRPAFAARTMGTNTTATADLQSVNAAVIPRAQDIGKTVGTYVLGRVSPEFLGYVGATPAPGSAADRIVKRAKANGDFILAQLTPGGWQVVTGQLTALLNGTLNQFNGAQNIFNNTPLAPGSQFCIGYGTDANQMLAGETLAEVLSLPGAASSAPGFPCAMSGVYVSGPATSKLGAPVGLKATVVGAGPTGTVQLKDGAANLGVPLTLVQQNAAVATASHVAEGLVAGDHSIGAHYSGDGRNAAADVAFPMPHFVEALPSGTAVALVGNASSTVGDSVAFTATVTGNNPSGTLQLRVGGAALGPPVPLDSQFRGVLAATGLAAGEHSITAAYSGDATNAGSTSNTVLHLVAPAILTSVALSASANPAISGNPVTLTAAVTGNSPGGSVVFRDGNEVLGSAGVAGGSAALAVPGFAAGVHALTAEYTGDTNNQRVTSPTLSLAVELAQPTAASVTTLQASASASTLGQFVTFTASVAGNVGGATGTVEFRDGGSAIPGCGAVAIVSGTATCVTNALAAGGHSITAVYSGDGVYVSGASSAQPHTVSAGAQLLLVSPASLDFGGQSVQTSSPPLTATFTNTSASAVTIASLTPPAGFAIVAHDCTTIAPQASCSVSLAFTPPSPGALGGHLALGYAGGGPSATPVAGVGEKDLVTHYYRAILRRAPDPGGKAFWQGEAARMAGLGANVNETWFAMSMAFYGSGEYAALQRDTTGFVTDLYNTFFNRPPDGGGLGFWKGQIDAGMPREVALVSFMFSPEFAAFTQGIFGNTAARAEVDAVVDFYRGLLSRLPDNGGFVHWVQQFRNAQCLGAAAVAAQADSISAQFIASGEYAARNRNDSQYVGDLYNAFLRRGGDLGGVQYWINQISGGFRTREQVRVEFRNSSEFQARVSAIIASGCVR